MNLKFLKIKTINGSDFLYEDDDATAVYNVINIAIQRGAEWTMPAKLKNGVEIVFQLRNIVKFNYRTEESE